MLEKQQKYKEASVVKEQGDALQAKEEKKAMSKFNKQIEAK
jgi:hypothetical protein